MKLEELELKLGSLLKKMDIPDYRKNIQTIHNYRWLEANLKKRNSEKGGFDEAMVILAELVEIKK